MKRYTANPQRIVADAMTCDKPWSEDALNSAEQRWVASGGVATVNRQGDKRYTVELDADLLDDSGAESGSLSAKGTFTHCLVSVDGLAEILL